MMHAQIIDGTIANLRATPTGGAWEDDQWLDFTDADTLAAWEERHGYVRVVETPRPVDTTTHTHRAVYAVTGNTVTQAWETVPKSAEQIAAEKHIADLNQLRADIVTKAIAWLETDVQQAQTRATAISNAVTTVQTRKSQVQAFTFNGANVAAINTQLNNSLKPLLIDMLNYIIGLGNITSGLETWRGDRVDPALVWLARHGTDTTT